MIPIRLDSELILESLLRELTESPETEIDEENDQVLISKEEFDTVLKIAELFGAAEQYEKDHPRFHYFL